MGHVTLVKPNVMQKLDRMNIIIQLKVQSHQNTFEATSTTILHDLNEQKDFERLVLFKNCVT